MPAKNPEYTAFHVLCIRHLFSRKVERAGERLDGVLFLSLTFVSNWTKYRVLLKWRRTPSGISQGPA